MVSIIIPVHNCNEYTEACIESIFANTEKYSFEIILIDNGSNPPVKLKYLETKIIRNNENLGFPEAINQGIKAANGDPICILNNDVIVTWRWMDKLIYHLEHGLDMVGPLTNSISGPQQVSVEVYNNEDELNRVTNNLYLKNKGKHFYFHRLVGFCLLMKRSVIDKIGLFDERFTPGNYEDDDYCLRAIEAGFKLGIAQDVFIHHFGSITHNELNIEYEKLLRKNKKYFDSKWSENKYKQLIERSING